MPNEKNSRSLPAIMLGAGLMIALVLAMFAASAQAAPGKGDSGAKVTGDAPMTPVMTTTPEPHRTPLPIRLRPWVQFGHARPGGTAHYRQVLFNHLPDPTMVDLGGGSLRGWNVRVNPTQTTTLPAYANIVTTTVGVPSDPDHWIDIERTHASISSTVPFTTSAYMITITRRHPWVDLQDGNWADDPVQYLVDQGVISGYADGSFRPNENVTRAQFAKMLVLAAGWTVLTPVTPRFNDVPSTYWAYGYIETAVAHGVISGYGDGSFRPGNPVTRGQVAKMIFISRGWTLDSPTYTNFTDVHAGDWTYNYVQAISSAEVMSGYQDSTFRPGAPATRAQIAKILTLSLFSDPNN